MGSGVEFRPVGNGDVPEHISFGEDILLVVHVDVGCHWDVWHVRVKSCEMQLLLRSVAQRPVLFIFGIRSQT